MKASAWGSASAAVAGILTISQGPWTALISIFSPGLTTCVRRIPLIWLRISPPARAPA